MTPKFNKLVKEAMPDPDWQDPFQHQWQKDMAGAVRGVLKSLTDKDGHYDRKEADTISNLFGKQINLIKVKLEAVKLSGGNAEKSKQLLS